LGSSMRPEAALVGLTSILHCLEDLELHLMQHQQHQQQQVGLSSPIGAMTDWVQAAW
jgi:hypothetical protein